jgi:DNA repair ATPase RecN
MKRKNLFLAGAFSLLLSLGISSAIQAQHQGHASHMKSEAVENIKVFANADGNVKSHIQQLTENYLKLKDALVQDNLEETKAAAKALESEANSYNNKLPGDQQAYYVEQVNMIREDAQHIQETGAVSHQRDHLNTLGRAVYRLNKAFDANGQALYYQHCPMAMDNKGAFWLSADKEVKNPYFGSKMLKCGMVKEEI